MAAFADTSAAKAVNMPFEQAQEFLRRKVSVTSERWTELWQEQHANAFTVAGATKQALVDDLRAAVQSAIDDGTTLADFQKRFREIALSHGWAYKGSESWRAKTIFETNLRTAYAAGRYEQLQAAKRFRPFWRYRIGDSKNHRAEHAAWDGLILRADDPWWETHYPPNGWGCRCRVESLDRSDLREMGVNPDELTDGKAVQRDKDGKAVIGEIPNSELFYEWTSKDGTRTERIPVGVQPGWAYNVGKAGADVRRAERQTAQGIQSPPPSRSAAIVERKRLDEVVGVVPGTEIQRTGVAREAVQRLDLDQMGLGAATETAPDMTHLPEASWDAMNERLKAERRPFEILRRPEKDVSTSSAFRDDPVAGRILEHNDQRRIALPANQSTGKVHLASALGLRNARSRGTSVCAEEIVRTAVESIRAGQAVELLGSDGINYYRVGANTFAAKRADSGGIDFFPISGPDMVFLGGDRGDDANKFTNQVRANGKAFSWPELEIKSSELLLSADDLDALQRMVLGGGR